MRILLPVAAAAAAALAAAPAAAQVSGPRVEAVIGYESATLDDFGSQDDVSESGILYGLGVGYDIPVGPTIALGIDLEATDSAVNWRETSTAFATDLRIALGRDLYAGARITAAVSPSLNLYAKAGYTNLSTRLDFTSPTFSEVIEADEGGLRVGAGAQFAVGANSYIGAEYRYSSYDGDLRRHQGVAALGFRF
ncbi:MAG TPA: porin family protein [Allosphingosinicella sp.]|nr:porin family protein [Allosphingosinicella sp.]